MRSDECIGAWPESPHCSQDHFPKGSGEPQRPERDQGSPRALPRVPLQLQTPRRAELHGVESRPQVPTDPRSPEEDLTNLLSKPGTF